jgi:uncharacterized protein YjbI with pentapeptide repeats
MREGPSVMPAPPLPQDSVIEDLTFAGMVSSIESGKLYSRCVFDNVLWSGVDITDVKFVNCRFVSNTFDNATLSGCLFQEVEFGESVRFTRCRIDGNVFSGVLSDELRYEACELTSNTWHQVAASTCVVRNCVLHMNSWTECQFQRLSWGHCQLRDEGMAEVKCGALDATSSNLLRVMAGGLHLAQLNVVQCSGEMIRFFKSQIDKVVLQQVDVAQWAMAHCQITNMSVSGGALPLLQMQSSAVQTLTFDNVPLDRALFDDSEVGHWHMVLVTMKGGSLRQVRADRLKVGHSTWTEVDARGFQLGLLECSNFRVEKSNFVGQDERQWGGVDFRKTEFEQVVSFEEKQWWNAFRQGAPDVIS